MRARHGRLGRRMRGWGFADGDRARGVSLARRRERRGDRAVRCARETDALFCFCSAFVDCEAGRRELVGVRRDRGAGTSHRSMRGRGFRVCARAFARVGARWCARRRIGRGRNVDDLTISPCARGAGRSACAARRLCMISCTDHGVLIRARRPFSTSRRRTPNSRRTLRTSTSTVPRKLKSLVVAPRSLSKCRSDR